MVNQTVNSFPNTYSIYAQEQLLNAYIQGPSRIRYLVADLTDAELKERLRGPLKWSIYETVIHIADSEMMGALRFKQCITRSDRNFAYYNQDIWLKILGYSSYTRQQFEEILDLFDLTRRHIYRLLLTLNPEDWAKTAIHQEMGELSLRNILELYADHSERHISQIIESKKKINKNVEINLLLPVRLY